jgi:deoxycytidine triphosphate deaminase
MKWGKSRMPVIEIPNQPAMVNIGSNNSNSWLSQWVADQVQPNAVDIKIDKLFEMNSEKTFIIDENSKQHRGTVEMEPNAEGYFTLLPGKSYEFVAEGTVKIGEDEAGFVITRSTLNRNGVFITSGLYDSGYHGVMAGVIHNLGGPSLIAKGARIGQFLLWKAEAVSSYDGDYGVGKKHDAKYS